MKKPLAYGTVAAALVALGLALAAGSTGAQEEVAAEAEAPGEPLTGTFELAEPHAQAQRRVHRAIDRAADRVNFLIRGFARDRLRDKNPIHRRVQTRVRDGLVTVIYDDDRYTSAEGQWRSIVATGERVRLLQQVRGNRIYQRFVGEDGEKQMVLTFEENGPRMWLDVTVRSDKLPEPLRYRLPFRRT
jgi:hypothetical protein